MTEKIPSSVRVGSRPSACLMTSYSSGSTPCFLISAGVMGWLRIGSGFGGSREAAMEVVGRSGGFAEQGGKFGGEHGPGDGEAILARVETLEGAVGMRHHAEH